MFSSSNGKLTVTSKIPIAFPRPRQQGVGEGAQKGCHLRQLGLACVRILRRPAPIEQNGPLGEFPYLSCDVSTAVYSSCVRRLTYHEPQVPYVHFVIPISPECYFRSPKHGGLDPLCQVIVKPASYSVSAVFLLRMLQPHSQVPKSASRTESSLDSVMSSSPAQNSCEPI